MSRSLRHKLGESHSRTVFKAISWRVIASLTTMTIVFVVICVLALLIERVAEVACDASWSRIRHQLDKMQATEFFSIKHRFFRRNEITASTRSILKKLKISVPKKILSVEKHA